jgi:regulator of sirC expression with transglutaminase-like and TPR domain
MTKWLNIGVVDSEEWTPQQEGARWRQRTGRILVEGAGSGFGGRSLCLSKKPVPPRPYEVVVTVRLDDESGAAGLCFRSDGGDKHYGFYPTNGQLRLSRFEGPDVFSWKVLEQKQSPHYKPGDWNTIKVRVEKEKLLCYVNGELTIESTDAELPEGQVGLAKFRDTKAEFKGFQVGKTVALAKVSPEITSRITKVIDGLPAQGAPKPEVVDVLLPDATASQTLLRERAKALEQQAARLKQLAQDVQQRRVLSELTALFQGKDSDIDLLRAALLIAKLDNDDLDVDAYRKEVERMVRDLKKVLPAKVDEAGKLAALNKYLFAEHGFHGSRSDYYNRSNSYLNEVLDDREGLPITLSVLFIEMATRLGLDVVGIGLPGHFVVQFRPKQGEPQLIDVFEGGVPLSRDDAEKRVLKQTGQALREEQLAPVTKKAIITRMLHNLLGLARDDKDGPGMLRYLDAIVSLTPDAAEERWLRAALRVQAGQRQEAVTDIDWLLEHRPDGIDLDRVLEMRRMLTKPGR